MYKLLIADDEKQISDGLRDLINWNSLGFEITGIFKDGSEVIEFLKKYEADVVLTDIKMIFQSGIDVAKFVYENNIPVQIVLISGYSEVELAMMAIKYNVNDYILKPIDIDLLTEAMIKIKDKLDYEGDISKQKSILDHYERNIEEIKDVFFEELIIGSFKNENYIQSMFQLLYPRLDFAKSYCFTLILGLKNYNRFMQTHWNQTSNDLYNCLSNCINTTSAEIEYKLISKSKDELQLIGIVTDCSQVQKNSVEIQIEKNIACLQNDILKLLPITFQIKSLLIYQGIPDLVSAATPFQKMAHEGDMIEQAKKYIVEHIMDDISLEDVAEKFYFSQYYFSRLFKAKTGENLIDYIIRVKMDKAAHLLKNHKYKIYEISDMVGYKNHQYFTKVFKRYSGYTPNAYRSLQKGRF